MLNIIYWAAVQRGIFTKFTDILSASAIERRADQGNDNGKNRRFIFHIMMMLENNLQGLILMPLTKSFYVTWAMHCQVTIRRILVNLVVGWGI